MIQQLRNGGRTRDGGRELGLCSRVNGRIRLPRDDGRSYGHDNGGKGDQEANDCSSEEEHVESMPVSRDIEAIVEQTWRYWNVIRRPS